MLHQSSKRWTNTLLVACDGYAEVTDRDRGASGAEDKERAASGAEDRQRAATVQLLNAHVSMSACGRTNCWSCVILCNLASASPYRRLCNLRGNIGPLADLRSHRTQLCTLCCTSVNGRGLVCLLLSFMYATQASQTNHLTDRRRGGSLLHICMRESGCTHNAQR